MTLPQFQIQFDPLPEPGAVVGLEKARFSLLSERLIRMEYSPSGVFEDRPSQAFWYRRQAVPAYQQRAGPGDQSLVIETAFLKLAYRETGLGFGPANLSVLVKATGKTWQYGDSYWRGENLLGTARTLDEASGKVRLEPGLIARQGWAVVDDSRSLVFNESGWLEQRRQPENSDIYFFGYGHDYPAALREFSLVAGNTPLIPRWILGNWWSRYWAYTQDELLGLMREFQEHAVPLSVCIIDMDWHITKTGNRSSGWTGYTWNRELFPDPQGLIDRLHGMGLKTALNLHPADGVHPHEEQYRALAELMGQDPEQGEPVPFDSADPKFIQGYFELLHHPYEAQGVDFWWLDWQQGGSSKLPGLDPLWWLNHLHFHDLGREGQKRPFIFSRWGGLGNHRYPIGFSGDTLIGWEALANQPGFTATAANVGYGWWSHDIGGHMGGVEDDELYARWVQYGAFSPILRLHCTSNPYHERRPWGRGPAAAQAATTAMRLRQALIPYIYSMAWRNYTTSLPLATPIYYTHPEAPEAYQVPQQYWFGSELVAAPFTAPAHPETGLARQAIWLPGGAEGEAAWFNFFTGERLVGGQWRTIYGELEDIPVFARAGAIVPLAGEASWGSTENPATLRVLLFPGADNRFELVEDDGETNAYLEGAYAVTVISQAWSEGECRLSVAPARGEASLLPAQREIQLWLRGVRAGELAAVKIDGVEISAGYRYDAATETMQFDPLVLRPENELLVVIRWPDGTPIHGRERGLENLRKFLRCFRLESWNKQRIDGEWAKIVAGELSLRSFGALSDAQLAVLEQLL